MGEALPDLQAFGNASLASGSGLVYKLIGRGDSEDSYQLVLEVTDALSSYAAKFSLEALMDFVSDESGVAPSGAILLEWLRERCCGGTLHATVAAAGGVTLSGVHMAAGDLPVALRLPPQAPAQRLADPRRAAWVTQDILFTQAERLCVQAGAPERCPVSQQLEDALAFLAAVAGGDAAASPAPPRATQHKRKEPEAAAAAPASGSAVKAPRPDEALAAAAGRPTAAAGAGAAIATAAAAAAHRLPASTQQTGSTQRTDVSEVGKPKKVSGRGRGGPPQRPGLARKK